MKNTYLESLKGQVDAISEEAAWRFAKLSREQLNWKPAPEQWSIAQCLDHLIVTNRQYIPQIEAIIEGKKRTTFWERLPWLPHFFGRLIIQSVDPARQKKVKTFDVFEPRQSDIPLSIVEDFRRHNEVLKSMMHRSDHVDHKKSIITSPAASYITYSLHDAFQFMVLHEKRHINQARKLTERKAFPQ
jgi:hypothetical protein